MMHARENIWPTRWWTPLILKLNPPVVELLTWNVPGPCCLLRRGLNLKRGWRRRSKTGWWGPGRSPSDPVLMLAKGGLMARLLPCWRRVRRALVRVILWALITGWLLRKTPAPGAGITPIAVLLTVVAIIALGGMLAVI